MKFIQLIIAIFIIFLTGIVLSQADNVLTNRCILAESISAEFRKTTNTNILSKHTVLDMLGDKNTDDILQDIRIYADIFKAWSKLPPPNFANQYEEKMEEIKKDTTLSKKEKKFWLVRLSHDIYDKHIYPISCYGFIISVEMIEIANRYETNAIPHLRQIAETELPQELEVPTQARIKGRYQKPAAEAWVRLKMPKELTDDEQKTWLIEFIETEKKLDKRKKWAIEAAQRIMRNIDNPQSSIPSPPNPVLPSEE